MRRRVSIAELRAQVHAATKKLAAEDSDASCWALGHILEALGWLNNFTLTTCRRMRDGIDALVVIAAYDEVKCAAACAAIELENQRKRLECATRRAA